MEYEIQECAAKSDGNFCKYGKCSMNIRPRYTRDEVNPNVTPLIDVVFLLLIFFMVSTTFEHNSEINITLPEASQEILEARPDSINVGIDGEAKIYINDKPLINNQVNTIRNAIAMAAVEFDEPPVVISADANATHQSVVRVMDAARQLGLAKITFATIKIEEEE